MMSERDGGGKTDEWELSTVSLSIYAQIYFSIQLLLLIPKHLHNFKAGFAQSVTAN